LDISEKNSVVHVIDGSRRIVENRKAAGIYHENESK